MRESMITWVPVLATVCFLSACATSGETVNAEVVGPELVNAAATAPQVASPADVDEPLVLEQEGINDSGPVQPEVFVGDGRFIDTEAARRNAWSSGGTSGDVVLNFEDSDIREVVKTILGDILGANYVVDPAVTGKVTLSTSRAMSTSQVLQTL